MLELVLLIMKYSRDLQKGRAALGGGHEVPRRQSYFV